MATRVLPRKRKLRKTEVDPIIVAIQAAANPNRRGGPYRLGTQGAFQKVDNRRRKQDLHDHYRKCEARARRKRFALLGWPLVGELEQIRREEQRKLKASRN